MNNNKLSRIISEVIDNFIAMNDIGIDISKIPLETLKKGYHDYRLVPKTIRFGDRLSVRNRIIEAVGDIVDADEVVRTIINRYNIPNEFVSKVEHHHKIYVYAITALIGKNDKIIEDDMKSMGYFLSHKGDVFEYFGMKFQVLQFEPTTQLQEDVTEEVINNNSKLYHWTLEYNMKSITEIGLIPKCDNGLLSFPPRIYLIGDNTEDKEIFELGQELCIYNDNEKNDGTYCLLSIELNRLQDNVRFYYDPNSSIGIFTEDAIPKEAIDIKTKFKFQKNILKN